MTTAEQTHAFNVPDVYTKLIKVYEGTEHTPRKFRFSSNALRWMGFDKDQRLDILKRGRSLEVRAVTEGPQKVYERRYRGRRANPTETQIEFTRADIMQHFPRALERVHVRMTNGLITLTPIANRAFSIREQMQTRAEPLETVFAMSSGIDMIAAKETGFSICGALDWRAPEKRDEGKGDSTESGIMTVLGNFTPRMIVNENVYEASYETWRSFREHLDTQHIPIMITSTDCKFFSRLKSEEDRLNYDNLSNTRDMFIAINRGIEALDPGIVVVECTEDFFGSTEEQLLTLTMRKKEYFATSGVLDARDYGGYTGRRRAYIVYSVFPKFEMPTPTHDRTERNVWEELVLPHLHECQDVTDNSGPYTGQEAGRARLLTANKRFAPTPIKSDIKKTKDAIYISHEGRYYFPSLNLYKALMGIPEDFTLDNTTVHLAYEQVGQGVDVYMQRALMAQIRRHISENVGSEYISPIFSSEKEVH